MVEAKNFLNINKKHSIENSEKIEKLNYNVYKDHITINLKACLKKIYIDVKDTLNKIGNISEDKFNVYIVEIRDLLDDNPQISLIDFSDNNKQKLLKIDKLITILNDDIIPSIETAILKGESVYPNISIKGIPISQEDSESEPKEIITDWLKKRHEDKEFLISNYTICSKTMFYIVLELENQLYNKYINDLEVKNYIGLQYNSFLKQVIYNIFDSWRERIYYKMSNSFYNDVLTCESIIELASMDLIYGRGLPQHNLFTYFSSLNYESNRCRGKFAFVERDQLDEIDEFIRFNKKVNLTKSEARNIRKLLETTQDDYYLIVIINQNNKFQVEGIGKISESLIENIDIIDILGHMEWSLKSKNKEIMKYDGLNMKLPNIEHTIEYYNENIASYFGKHNVNSQIGQIIEEAKKQSHGTMIIISKNADKEVDRLCEKGRGISIQPINLIEKIDSIRKITSIDGSVMIDLNGSCYGIGIIVDGETKVDGNPSRGARYNSAKNYVYGQNEKSNICMAFVISEDKTIDILY